MNALRKGWYWVWMVVQIAVISFIEGTTDIIEWSGWAIAFYFLVSVILCKFLDPESTHSASNGN